MTMWWKGGNHLAFESKKDFWENYFYIVKPLDFYNSLFLQITKNFCSYFGLFTNFQKIFQFQEIGFFSLQIVKNRGFTIIDHLREYFSFIGGNLFQEKDF